MLIDAVKLDDPIVAPDAANETFLLKNQHWTMIYNRTDLAYESFFKQKCLDS